MRISSMNYFGLWLAAVVLSACGGSGGTNVAEGGIGGTGMSVGVVTQVGSVTVNGVKFSTEGAQITINDQSFTDTTGQMVVSNLFEGMVVKVDGTVNADGATGSATAVTYLDNLEGPIQGTPVGNSFSVLNQAVWVDDLTRYGGGISAVGELMDADVVSVSGHVGSDGSIRATYVEKLDALAQVQIKGVISALNDQQKTFVIGGYAPLTVDYSNADYPLGLANDLSVEVEGMLINETLAADKIELFELYDKDIAEVEYEGIVTAPNSSAQTFFINGIQQVDYSLAEFDGGTEIDLVSGVHIEVEGAIVAGVLEAESIEFRESVELSGEFDKAGNTLTMRGTDISVLVDESITEVSGDTASSYADIFSGDLLEIRARQTGDGLGLLATRIDRKGPGGSDNSIAIQGVLEAVNDPSITLLGVEIDTTGVEFSRDNPLTGVEDIIDASIFFSVVTLSNGSPNTDVLVAVEGSWDGFTLVWDKVELDE